MEFMMTRRQLVGGAAAVALLGLTGLTGCDGGGLSGKALYAFSTSFNEKQPDVDEGSKSTFTFNDDKNWSYTGSIWDYVDEMSGTWAQEGDAIVLTSSGAYNTITLQKVVDQDSYTVLGMEDAGIRFFFDEDAALEYVKQYISDSQELVCGILESNDWESPENAWTQVKAPEISFSDRELDYVKGEYTETVPANPMTADWESKDHSGEYELMITSLLGVGPNDVPVYGGMLSMDGEQLTFTLRMSNALGKKELTVGRETFMSA